MIEPHRGVRPEIHPSAWVHPSAILIGEVRVGPRVTVWPCTVLRGDHGFIEVGEESNLQDGTICHGTDGVSTTTIGARVTVGHRALLHGCTIADDCLIGMGAILLDNCTVGRFSIIGAAALVPVGRAVPERSLVLGVPGRVVRGVDDAEVDAVIRHGHREYQKLLDELRS
jgi:gamma-carbonic anhydrase